VLYVIYNCRNRKRRSVSFTTSISIPTANVWREKKWEVPWRNRKFVLTCVPTIVNGHNCGLHMHAGCATLPGLTVPYSTVKCDVRVLSVAAYQIGVIARSASLPLSPFRTFYSCFHDEFRAINQAHFDRILLMQTDSVWWIIY